MCFSFYSMTWTVTVKTLRRPFSPYMLSHCMRHHIIDSPEHVLSCNVQLWLLKLDTPAFKVCVLHTFTLTVLTAFWFFFLTPQDSFKSFMFSFLVSFLDYLLHPAASAPSAASAPKESPPPTTPCECFTWRWSPSSSQS